jgi:hypothetical protein
MECLEYQKPSAAEEIVQDELILSQPRSCQSHSNAASLVKLRAPQGDSCAVLMQARPQESSNSPAVSVTLEARLPYLLCCISGRIGLLSRFTGFPGFL